jgi:hypothetical protein
MALARPLFLVSKEEDKRQDYKELFNEDMEID